MTACIVTNIILVIMLHIQYNTIQYIIYNYIRLHIP